MLFRCLIRGENFPGEVISEVGKVGFYTTRLVEAGSEEEAEANALTMLRQEPMFEVGADLRSKDARVYFEEIVQVEPTTPQVPNTGATWFPMER